MGTLATFFRRTDFIPTAVEPAAQDNTFAQLAARVRTWSTQSDTRNPFELRALPNDDVYFYCKRIDNSRLVRQADPQSKGQCWSAIGAACVIASLFGTVMAPKAATVLAGYKLQSLKQERIGLLDERKAIEVEEARLLSPVAMDRLATRSKLSTPLSGQIVRLQPKGDTAVASMYTSGGLQSR